MCKLLIHHDGCACPPIVAYEACFEHNRSNAQIVGTTWKRRTWLDRMRNKPPTPPKLLLQVDCPKPAAQVHSTQACPDCIEKKLQQVKAAEKAVRIEQAKKRMVRAKWMVEEATWRGGVGDLSPALVEAKEAYLCVKCLYEDRDPGWERRAVNGGFCCARGMNEWEGAFGKTAAREIFQARHVANSGRTVDVDVRRPQVSYVPAGFHPAPQSAMPYSSMDESVALGSRDSMASFALAVSAMGIPGVNEGEWNTQVPTDHGTIPRPPGGHLPPTPAPTPARSTRDLIRPGASLSTPSRPSNLRTPEKRPLPDIPNFKPGISDVTNTTRGVSKGRHMPEHAPLQGGFSDVSFSESDRPYTLRRAPNLSPGSSRPQPLSPTRIVPYASMTGAMDNSSMSSLQRSSSKTHISRPQTPSSNTRQPNPSSSTMGEPFPSKPFPNPRHLERSPSNLNKPIPPLPSPQYPPQSPLHPSPSITRTANPRNLPSSSTSSTQTNLPVRSATPSSTSRKWPKIETSPSSSVRTTSSPHTRPPYQESSTNQTFFSTSPLPPKSRAETMQRREQSPPPFPSPSSPRGRSISPVSSTNSRWEEVDYNSPRASSDTRESSSPVSPLSLRRGSLPFSASPYDPESSLQGWMEGSSSPLPQSQMEVQVTPDPFKRQDELEEIQGHRERRGVLTMIDYDLEDALMAWTGPKAMTRTEREEKERKEGL